MQAGKVTVCLQQTDFLIQYLEEAYDRQPCRTGGVSPSHDRDPDRAGRSVAQYETGESVYDNYTLIRYYRDSVVVVCCKIAGGKVNEVRTWFPLMAKKAYRRTTGGNC